MAALARAVAPLVIAHIGAALGLAQAPYSTRKGFEPPEYRGCVKRWKRDATTIPGASKIGRWTVVPRDAYARWLASRTMTAPATPPKPEPWSADKALRNAGLRMPRRFSDEPVDDLIEAAQKRAARIAQGKCRPTRPTK